MKPALRTEKLTKHFGDLVAVDGIDLEVREGEVFGFLGPNGAGKTTTIKMLLSFIRPTSGDAWLFDRPIQDDAARRRVGYLPEQPYFPKFLNSMLRKITTIGGPAWICQAMMPSLSMVGKSSSTVVWPLSLISFRFTRGGPTATASHEEATHRTTPARAKRFMVISSGEGGR